MKSIFTVQHTQSEHHTNGMVGSWTDWNLTELGKQQAAQTGKKLLEMGVKIDEILYSPLSRARDTALIISEIIGIPAKEEPRLIEQNFGKYEGTARDGEEFKKSKAHFADRYEGGESMLQLSQRIYNLLDDVKIRSDEKTYLLVAHNGIARMVNSYFNDMTNEEYASFGIKNAQVVKYDFE